MNSIVVAAPHSGSGKTTLTLGIMAALKRRGLVVAPFKVGPDFIDPGYHRLVTGTPSVNLDGWICGECFLRESFRQHALGADIAVVEGGMGLFDGIDGVSEAGSSAQIAKFLRAAVVLVVDARSQARSAAALLHGFATFDPQLKVAGVIFNNVASANHEAILREAVAAHSPEIAFLGCIPRDAALAIPSRHLGLLTAEENPLSEDFLGHLVEVIERHLDLEALLALGGAGDLSPHPQPDPPLEGEGESAGGEGREGAGQVVSLVAQVAQVKIAVARDAAFCFVYEDNLRLLREQGAELCLFSPLDDEALPTGISGIYLPGGYPELFAPRLAANRSLKAEIRQAVEADMPVYAECGGFIYLTRGVAAAQGSPLRAGANGTSPTEAGTEASPPKATTEAPAPETVAEIHPLVGIFPVTTRMLPRRKALGYREVELLGECVLGGAGTRARGHEFHYSEMEQMPPQVERVYRVLRKGVPLGPEGYRYRNCLASYIHLHFGSNPAIARDFVGQCRAYTTRSLT